MAAAQLSAMGPLHKAAQMVAGNTGTSALHPNGQLHDEHGLHTVGVWIRFETHLQYTIVIVWYSWYKSEVCLHV
jgi:hypothetical protein